MLWVGMMRRTNRDFEYEITESGVEILRCFAFGGKGAVIEIPEKIEGEAVTAVGRRQDRRSDPAAGSRKDREIRVL